MNFCNETKTKKIDRNRGKPLMKSREGVTQFSKKKQINSICKQLKTQTTHINNYHRERTVEFFFHFELIRGIGNYQKQK